MRKRDIVNAVVSDTGLSSVEAADAVESVFTLSPRAYCVVKMSLCVVLQP